MRRLLAALAISCCVQHAAWAADIEVSPLPELPAGEELGEDAAQESLSSPPPSPSSLPSSSTAIDAQPLPPPPPEEEINAIRLQGLNKVTARTETLEAPLGTIIRFGNLEIIAKRCWRAPAGQQPENAGLLEVWELKQDEGPQKIFSGWMFASSPALSALEHPVYDITVLTCLHQDLKDE